MLKYTELTDVDKLYFVSDSPLSQHRNKKIMFLMKQWAKNNKIDVYWIFTYAGHGKKPMDGVGACIKQTIKDTVAYNPNGMISNTEELMQHMPELPNICISTYGEDDVNSYGELLPHMDYLKIVEPGVFGISKVHEIFFLKEDNGILYWKKVSSDNEYAEAQIIGSKIQKRFKAKEQNKDDVLREDRDDDSESTTDDDIEEEEARRSASCILFFSVIVKTKYTANISTFNIHIHKPYRHIKTKKTLSPFYHKNIFNRT